MKHRKILLILLVLLIFCFGCSVNADSDDNDEIKDKYKDVSYDDLGKIGSFHLIKKQSDSILNQFVEWYDVILSESEASAIMIYNYENKKDISLLMYMKTLNKDFPLTNDECTRISQVLKEYYWQNNKWWNLDIFEFNESEIRKIYSLYSKISNNDHTSYDELDEENKQLFNDLFSSTYTNYGKIGEYVFLRFFDKPQITVVGETFTETYFEYELVYYDVSARIYVYDGLSLITLEEANNSGLLNENIIRYLCYRQSISNLKNYTPRQN